MLVSDFHFELPAELIAQHPPAERGGSRMLVLQQGTGVREQGSGHPVDGAERGGEAGLAGWALRDAQFRDLPDLLRAGDLLVLNDSRVIPARLFARRVSHPENGREPAGKIEVLLTERIPGNGSGASNDNVWRALVKPGRKVRVGQRLEFFASDTDSREPVLAAEVIATGERGERTLRFAPVADFNAVLARIGHMPLPPYIRHGQDEAADRERYQTVYARETGPHEPGSAAAPTAGLHFTPGILSSLRARGVEIAYVTLHVGLGTFQPVRVSQVEEIRLHAEHYTLPAETADALKRALRDGRRVVAVGTTTTRTLEHIAREAGADAFTGSVPHERSSDGAPGEAHSHVSKSRQGVPHSDPWIEKIAEHTGETSIFISPGHRFRIVSGLLTNFHLPQSTLLMLVSAFAADRMAQNQDPRRTQGEPDADAGRSAVLAAYAHAVRERYRFFSYGDCMLLV